MDNRAPVYLSRNTAVRLLVGAVFAVLLTGAVVGCGTSRQSHPITGSSGHKSHTTSTAQAEYTGPSWAEYLKTTLGQSCVLVGDQSVVAGAHIAAYLTQKVVSATPESGGERLMYRMTTHVTDSEPSATLLPPISYLLPYDIESDGKLGTAPGPTSEPGLDVEWGGSELYPTIDELRAGRSAQSSIVLSAKATETASQHALEKELEPGQTRLKIHFNVTAKPAPALASIHTPDGTFTNLVGVTTQMGSGEALDINPAYAAKYASLMTSFGKAFSGTKLYFAHGVGMVASEGAFGNSKLQSCSG